MNTHDFRRIARALPDCDFTRLTSHLYARDLYLLIQAFAGLMAAGAFAVLIVARGWIGITLMVAGCITIPLVVIIVILIARTCLESAIALGVMTDDIGAIRRILETHVTQKGHMPWQRSLNPQRWSSYSQ